MLRSTTELEKPRLPPLSKKGTYRCKSPPNGNKRIKCHTTPKKLSQIEKPHTNKQLVDENVTKDAEQWESRGGERLIKKNKKLKWTEPSGELENKD